MASTSFSASVLNSTTTPKSVTGLSWSSGDVIIVMGGAETASTTLNTPTNANLTFSLQASNTAGGAGDCDIYIWRAVAGSSQSSQTIQGSRGATSGQWGFFVWIDTGVSGTTANASANLTESNFTFTPTAGSIVHYAFFDWNADATSQTIATGTGTATERADSNSAAYGWYAGDWVNVTATSTSFGLSSFTGLRIAHGVIEVLASSGAVTGTATETQDDQTSTASGQLGYSGTATETQDNQTSTATGVIEITGTVARTQANQTSTATGQLGYSGTCTRTQQNQTSSASGTVAAPGVSGTAAVTQQNQTSTISGQLGYSGTSSRTQANQTSSASGTFTAAGFSGSAAVTQANQTSTATGQLGYSGTSARTQSNQTSTASGTFTAPPITGSAAVTQANQTAVAGGFIGAFATPDSRTYVVALDPRTLAIDGDRVFMVPALQRIAVIDLEVRTAAVPNDLRALLVPAP